MVGMSRDPLHTVTLPLLVNADDENTANGECAVFPSRGGETLVKVQAVSPEIAKGWLERDTRSTLARALKGLGRLRHAYTEKDDRKLLAAVDQCRPLMPKLPLGMTQTEDWTGEGKWDGARWYYAEAMSHAAKNARLVVWWPFSGQHEPTPGLYCPDMSTAVAMALFMDGVRVCPFCGETFIPKLGKARTYCKSAHGVADRTARSRDKTKRAEALIRANSDLSVPKLIEKLAEAGIKRARDWVVKAKARVKAQKR
jgi:hypothetical protein